MHFQPRNWMEKFSEVLKKHISNPEINNALLASEMNMSERQFYRTLERETGMTPNHYIRECRMEIAAELLRSGEYRTVKEIAMRVGFIKVSYFSKLFYESEGVRPSELL